MALGTEFIVSYLADITRAVKGAKDLEAINANTAKNIIKQYGEVKRIVGDIAPKSVYSTIETGRFAGLQKEILTTGKVIETTKGKFLEFGQTNTIIAGQIYKTTGAVKDVTGQFAQTALGSAKADKSLKSLGENFWRLASRAVLTIPVWMALRAAVTGSISAMTNGFQDLVNESLALQKVKNTLQGTTETIVSDLEKIKNETQALALESGVSHEKIIATFQKFSSVGLDVATAMAATNATIKLAVITQGDATASAEGFAHALAVLIPTNATVGEKQKQINDIMALTAELWKTNGFNIEAFTDSLEKFAITSKSVNLTTSQTLALLATLSKSGLGSAGNLLRNSIGQLLVNMDKLAGSLGVKVNPQLDNTFTILVKVLEQLNNLQKVNDLKGLESAKEALKDIFGGTRSAVPIVALTQLYDALQKNISLTADVNTLNASFKDTEQVLGNVVNRYHTANAEIGKAFVNGIIGGENFNATLEKIVKNSNTLIPVAEAVGESVAGILSMGIGPVTNTMKKEVDALNKSINTLGDSIVRGLKGKLTGVELTGLLNQLEVTRKQIGVEINDPMIWSDAELKRRIDSARRLNDTINLLKKVGPIEKAPQTSITDDKLTTNAAKRTTYTKEETEVAKSLLGYFSKKLEYEGALKSQILLATQLRIQQLGIEEKTLDQLNRRLEIEQAINEEKRLQGRLSSDTMKLYDISKTSGIEITRQVGDVLAGNIDLDMFIRRGGEAADVFIKNFAEVYKQKQAEQFFKGERVTGEPNLYGGTRIAIQEEAIRKYPIIPSMVEENKLQRLINVNASTPINVNANIDISKLDEVKQKFIDEVTKQLPQVGTDVNNALVQALAGKQGNTL